MLLKFRLVSLRVAVACRFPGPGPVDELIEQHEVDLAERRRSSPVGVILAPASGSAWPERCNHCL
jgi:hypothetical protein